MKIKSFLRIGSLICAVSIVVSALFCPTVVSKADSLATVEQLRAVANNYVETAQNEATLAGFVAAIQAIDETASVAEEDFYIRHAVAGAKDDDTTSGYPFVMAGSDGAVSAVIKTEKDTIYFTCAFSHKEEIIHIEEVAVVGKSSNFSYDASGNVMQYSGSADKIVFPAGYRGTMSYISMDSRFKNRDKVKIVMLLNSDKRPPLKANAFNGGTADNSDISQWKWKSLVALSIYPNKNFLWETGDGKTRILDQASVNCLPNLKYLILPEKLDNTDAISGSNFTKLPKLENVLLPATHILKGAFTDTGLREVVLKAECDSDFASSSKYGFSGGTINIIHNTDEMTEIQAAAYMAAAVHEQLIAGKTGNDAFDAAIAGVKGWNNDATGVIKSFTLSEVEGWTANGNYLTYTAGIAKGDKKFVLLLRKIDPEFEKIKNEINAAAAEYANTAKNTATLDGLLAAVHAISAEVTVSAKDFYVKHSVPGVTDNDTQYPLSIKGSDGAVSAIFRLGTDSFGFAKAFAHIDEKITVNKVAVVGKDPQFSYDNDGNVTGYGGDAEKIVFPKDYTGTLNPITSLSQFPNRDKVKVLMFKNGDNMGTFKSGAISGWTKNSNFLFSSWGWSSLVALDIYSDKDYLWSTEDGKTKIFGEPGCVRYLPTLKYLALPYSMDNKDIIAENNFSNLPSLENANVPAKANISRNVFWNTSLRELTFGIPDRANYVENWGNAAKNESGYGPTGGTRNIILSESNITFAQAAAMTAASVHECVRAGVEREKVTKLAVQNLRGWSNGSDKYLSEMSVSFLNDWTIGDAEDTCTVWISNGGDTANLFVSDMKTLTGLSAEYELDRDYQPGITEYHVTVPNNVTFLNLDPVAAVGATITVTGNENFKTDTDNEVIISVRTKEGKTVAYTLHVKRDRIYTSEEVVTMVNEAASAFVGSNITSQKEYLKVFLKKLSSTGFSAELSDYYIYKAIGGAKDNYGILVPGYDGYITAKLRVSNALQRKDLIVKSRVAPELEEYYFNQNEVSVADDFIISKDGKTLEYYTGSAKKIVIPEGIESLDIGWFDGDVSNAQVIIFPQSLNNFVGYGICDKLRHLEVVAFGDDLRELPSSSFENCYMLKYIKLPESLEIIGSSAFRWTCMLGELYIPPGVKEVHSKAFWQSAVRYVVIGGSMETLGIDTWAFPSCGPSDCSYLYDDIKDKKDIDIISEYYNSNVMKNPEIRVLSAAVSYENAFSSNNSGAEGTIVTVYAPQEFKGGFDPGDSNSSFFFNLDMSFVEAAAFAQVAMDHAVITNKSTADDVLDMVKNSFYSTAVEHLIWVTPFAVSNGRATGTARIISGEDTYDISFDRPIYKATEITLYPFSYNTDDAFYYKSEGVTHYRTVKVPRPVEDSTESLNDKDSDNSQTTLKRLVRKRILIPWYMTLPYMIAVCAGGAVIIAGTAVLIIRIKKKKKQA